MRLVLFCAEKTQRLNYRLDDEAAGILKEIGLMPGGVAGGVGQTDTTTAEDAAQVDSPAGGVAKRDTLPNAGGVEPQGVAAIPDELNTEKAKKYLQMAVNGGLLNEDYSTTEKTKTKPQKALLAEILSERIGLSTKDSVFETLWGVKELRKARYKSKDAGKVRGEEEIYAVFPDARKRMR